MRRICLFYYLQRFQQKRIFMMYEKEQKLGLKIKKKLSLDGSSEECIHLDNQKFMHRYVNTNAHALSLIKYELHNQALLELQNVESELQNSVKSGKKTSDYLIFAVLHNLAFLHYKLGNYSKSLDYIRAILHNLNNRPPWSSKGVEFEQHMQSLCLTVNTAKLYLYFLNLALQLKMLEAGTIPANRAIEFYKKFSKEYQQSSIAPILISSQMNNKILTEIQQFQQIFVSKDISQIMTLISSNLIRLKKQARKLKNNRSIKELLSINIIQLSIQNKQVICNAFTPIKTFQNGLMEFPTVLFLTGKLNRQSALNKYKNKDDNARLSTALQKAAKYVLWSLYFACELSGEINAVIKQIYNFYDEFYHQVNEQTMSSKPFAVEISERSNKQIIKIWKQIKNLIQSSKNQEFQLKRYPDVNVNRNILPNKSENFQKLLIQQKQKHTINLQQKKVELEYYERPINAVKPNTKNNKLLRKKSVNQKSQNKIKLHKQNISKEHSKSTRKSKNQASIVSNRSNQSITKQSKKKMAKNQKQKDFTREATNEYFPKANLHQKYKKEENKNPRKLVENYLSLQKKINESSKNLQKKKKILTKSLKKY